jgi:hypothetical protein
MNDLSARIRDKQSVGAIGAERKRRQQSFCVGLAKRDLRDAR